MKGHFNYCILWYLFCPRITYVHIECDAFLLMSMNEFISAEITVFFVLIFQLPVIKLNAYGVDLPVLTNNKKVIWHEKIF